MTLRAGDVTSVNGEFVKVDSSGRVRRTVRWDLNLLDTPQANAHLRLEQWADLDVKATNLTRALLMYCELEMGITERLLGYFGKIVDQLVEQRVKKRMARMEREHAKRMGELQEKMDQLQVAIDALKQGGGLRITQETRFETIPPPPAPPFTLPSPGQPESLIVVEDVDEDARAHESAKNFVANYAGLFFD